MKALATVLFLAITALVYASGTSSQEMPTRVESEFESHWLTDYNKALAMSKETGKPVLMNFTGSDWCILCILLHNQLFSKKEFQKYAEENLILLELDFPQGKRLPEKLNEQNEILARIYGIRGYPTILLTDHQGQPFAYTTYPDLASNGYLTRLKSLVAKK